MKEKVAVSNQETRSALAGRGDNAGSGINVNSSMKVKEVPWKVLGNLTNATNVERKVILRESALMQVTADSTVTTPEDLAAVVVVAEAEEEEAVEEEEEEEEVIAAAAAARAEDVVEEIEEVVAVESVSLFKEESATMVKNAGSDMKKKVKVMINDD